MGIVDNNQGNKQMRASVTGNVSVNGHFSALIRQIAFKVLLCLQIPGFPNQNIYVFMIVDHVPFRRTLPPLFKLHIRNNHNSRSLKNFDMALFAHILQQIIQFNSDVISCLGVGQLEVKVRHGYVHKFIPWPMYLPVYSSYCIYIKVGLSRPQHCSTNTSSCCNCERYTCVVTCLLVQVDLLPSLPFNIDIN